MKRTKSLKQLSSLAVVPCLMSVTLDASAAVQCTPTAIVSGDMVALQGNCIETDTGMALTAGSEVWQLGTPGEGTPLGNRPVSGGPLNVPALPGEHTYYISAIDNGYGGTVFGGEVPYPSAVVNLPCPGEVAMESAARRVQPQRKRRLDHDCPAGTATGPAELAQPLVTLQSQRLRGNLDQAQSRMRTLRNSRHMPAFDVQGVPLPVARPDAASGASRERQRTGVYVLGLGDYLRQNRSDSLAGFKLRSTALSIGADHRLSDEWIVGGNVGGSQARVDFAESASEQKSRGGQGTAYASWSFQPSSYVSATVSYEATRYTLRRDDGLGGIATAAPRGRGLGLSLSAGHDIALDAWSIGPYVRYDSVSSRVRAFEEGGSDEAMSVSAQRVRSSTATVGAQVQRSVPVSWGLLLPYLRVEASYRTERAPDAPTATLVNGNTTVLLPNSADTSSGYGNLALGVSSVHLGGMSWFADFETGVAQKGYQSRRIGLGVRFEL